MMMDQCHRPESLVNIEEEYLQHMRQVMDLQYTSFMVVREMITAIFG
jgi:hypothetical protein